MSRYGPEPISHVSHGGGKRAQRAIHLAWPQSQGNIQGRGKRVQSTGDRCTAARARELHAYIHTCKANAYDMEFVGTSIPSCRAGARSVGLPAIHYLQVTAHAVGIDYQSKQAYLP